MKKVLSVSLRGDHVRAINRTNEIAKKIVTKYYEIRAEIIPGGVVMKILLEGGESEESKIKEALRQIAEEAFPKVPYEIF